LQAPPAAAATAAWSGVAADIDSEPWFVHRRLVAAARAAAAAQSVRQLVDDGEPPTGLLPRDHRGWTDGLSDGHHPTWRLRCALSGDI
jgi:hypothetical protein